MKERERISIEELRKRLEYDPELGLCFWLTTLGGKCRKGESAGRVGTGKSAGYWRININGRQYPRSNIAWALMTGKWPQRQVDHENVKQWDDRWVNLRLATQSQNKANGRAYKNNYLGVKGVCVRGSKYQAHAQIGGKQKHLGFFETIREAAQAVSDAHEKEYGVFSRTT